MKPILFLVLLLGAQLGAAQTFTVGGRIVDETGAALPGATVVLQGPAGEIIKGTAAADDGQFA